MIAEELLERVEAGGLIAPPAPVVAMLSGGRDSVCMLDLALRVRGAAEVRALHVNYRLRGEAAADERHCAELCRRLGVVLEVERPRRPEGSGNLQAWAREQRYAAAAGLAERLDSVIVTGHTGDDQVETILYRLASSPSRRALLGMRPVDGRLVRPLLTTTREETTAYCEERGLPWRDDASNEEAGYKRNLLRRDVIPELAKIHPAARENVLRTAALLREEAELLDSLVDAELAAGTRSPGSGSPSCTPRCAGWSSSALPTTRPAGPSPAPPASPSRSRACGAGGSRLDLGGGVRAVLEGGVLRAERQ